MSLAASSFTELDQLSGQSVGVVAGVPLKLLSRRCRKGQGCRLWAIQFR